MSLYIVATPIGNLGDITFRAVEALKSVDLIVCEDTRVSKKLLNHYDITTLLATYHEHNAAQVRPKLLAQLQAGESIALISDAGTPLISDPGYKLVQEAQEAGINIVPIPGANAAITALCASGLPTDQFTFAGFLPSKQQARKKALQALAPIPGTLVFYESAKRVLDTLAAIQTVLDEREVVIARELTKQFEEIARGPIADIIAEFSARESIKGEIVLLVGPASAPAYGADAMDALLREALKTMSTKEAAKHVAEQTGASKSDLYQRALEWKNES